jgi:CRISPR type III-B/RAMP module RAMP protein Cmr1
MFSGEAIKGNIELRPPAFKASLRYWWRALHAHSDIKVLQKQESEIFGGGGDNARKSVIEFVSLDINNDLSEQDKYKLPHKNRAQHKAYVSGTFSITYRITNTTIFSVDKLVSLMYISSILGGIGARARRGMGAWQITSIEGTDINLDISYNTILKHIEKFSDNYKIQNDKIIINKNQRKRYPYIKEIHIGKNGFDKVDVLTKCIIDKAHNAKNIYSDNCKNGAKFTVFEIFAGHSRRLASPMYISIIKKNEDNKYYPIMTILHTPDGTKCQTEGGKLIEHLKKQILAI